MDCFQRPWYGGYPSAVGIVIRRVSQCGSMFSTAIMWGQVANRGALNPTVVTGQLRRDGEQFEVHNIQGLQGTYGGGKRVHTAQVAE